MTENTAVENNETKVESKESVEEPKVIESKLVTGTTINETDKAVEITTEAAGYNKDTLDITVEKGVLTVTNKSVEGQNPEKEAVTKEFCTNEYKRVYRLSDKISVDEITAEVKDGVLRLTLPKVQAPEKRRIEVKAV